MREKNVLILIDRYKDKEGKRERGKEGKRERGKEGNGERKRDK
jgi:hypothetical protein